MYATEPNGNTQGQSHSRTHVIVIQHIEQSTYALAKCRSCQVQKGLQTREDADHVVGRQSKPFRERMV